MSHKGMLESSVLAGENSDVDDDGNPLSYRSIIPYERRHNYTSHVPVLYNRFVGDLYRNGCF